MTNCFGSNTVHVVFSYDLLAGSRLTTFWRLPSGQTTTSEGILLGPRAGNFVASVFYTDDSPLPNGAYTFEARTEKGLLARARFTRRC